MSEFRMNVQMLLFMYVHVHFSMLQPYKIKLWVQLKGRFSGLSLIFFQVVRSGERSARENWLDSDSLVKELECPTLVLRIPQWPKRKPVLVPEAPVFTLV